jgi:hypothetical protein
MNLCQRRYRFINRLLAIKSECNMAEQPGTDPIQEIQRKADEFARRQHEEVFKRFEQLRKPPSKGRGDAPVEPSEKA